MNQKLWILTAAVLGSSVVFLDSTVVNVALPRIGRDLPVHLFGVLEGQSYIYNGYLLTLSALLILAGALTDFYGRQRMFAIGLLGFGATSVLCGLAPTMELLIVFRVLQGAAGALLVPGSLALLTANFHGEEQGRAFGIWAGASTATTLLGPFVGGFMVDSISWRAAFLINVPLVLVTLWATLRFVPESRDDQASGRFDWLGALVVATAVGGLALGAIYGQQRDWHDPLGYIALALGSVATLALPILMASTKNPLIPLRLFGSRNFSVTNISTLIIYGALYVTGYYTGLFQQGTLGYTAAAAGLSFVPGFVLLAVLSPRFGALAGRYGPRWFMCVGPVVMALGILWFARIPATSQAWDLRLDTPASFLPPLSYFLDILPGGLVFGLGTTMLVAPLTTAVMTSVPVRNSGLASAINNSISRVGPQLAGALIFVAITASFYHALRVAAPQLDTSSQQTREVISPLNRPAPSVPPDQVEAARHASTEAFHLAMLVSAGLLVSGAVVNGVGIRNPEPQAGVQHPETPAERPAS